MNFLMPRIAQRMFNVPHLIAEDKAVAMLLGLGGRLVEGGVIIITDVQPAQHTAFERPEQHLGRIGDRMGRAIDQRGGNPYDVVDGVAIISIEGTLVHKGAYIGQSSGETSYQGIQTQVARAARDPQIKGVVFEIDSYGGQAAGAFETADMIYALSQAKPTIAILTDFAMSGGYLLAAPARQIVMPPLGEAGSIGVVYMHLDVSQKLANEGAKVTLITSGANKVAGHPAQPLSEAALATFQARADETRNAFAGSIGKYRGKQFTKAAAMATEAGTYTGAEAQRLGMVDAVAPANDAFTAFVKAVNRA